MKIHSQVESFMQVDKGWTDWSTQTDMKNPQQQVCKFSLQVHKNKQVN